MIFYGIVLLLCLQGNSIKALSDDEEVVQRLTISNETNLSIKSMELYIKCLSSYHTGAIAYFRLEMGASHFKNVQSLFDVQKLLQAGYATAKGRTGPMSDCIAQYIIRDRRFDVRELLEGFLLYKYAFIFKDQESYICTQYVVEKDEIANNNVYNHMSIRLTKPEERICASMKANTNNEESSANHNLDR